MNLIIVESPTKSKTLQKFLGKDYKITATMGHIRDLPKSELGIDIENNFKPKYIIPTTKRKNLSALKKHFLKAEKIILAADEDREGEAIAWHLVQALQLEKTKGSKPYQRIVFHEITKEAIKKALKNPREINMNIVDAQQARRILDRLVGYKLSPFLWKKVVRGLSAGRVQSVAVKLICEKEKEIEKFKPQEYWSIEALFQPEKDNGKNKFEASLFKKDNKIIPKLEIQNEEETKKIIKDLEKAEYKISKIERKEKSQNPLPPFTTSLLQQESWQKFHFPAKFTMRLAQSLYEKGLITYHRTDSFNLSEQSLLKAKKVIEEKFGKNYWAGYFRRYKTKSKSAQEAHEAIRPTNPAKDSSSITLKGGKNFFGKDAAIKLYDLIWKRFIACQMKTALLDSTTIEVETQDSKYTLKANGQIIKFDGFLKVYPLSIKEKILPELKKDEFLELIKLIPSQHFTQPPARYTEATLIKTLEKYGIGRPSTYAPIISTIQERNYINKNEKKKLIPTEMGVLINELLVKHFSNIVDVEFTAKMEKSLDKIAEGKIKWQEPIEKFYFPFEENLKKKEEEVPKKEIAQEKTKEKCPKCKKPLVIKLGRYGKFYACSGFPKCRFTKPYLKFIGIDCPKCKKGKVIEKKSKKGRIFYGCSNFPKCDYASWQKPK